MALTDKLTAIADATRAKTGTTNQMTLDEIATAINGISGGNIEVKSFVPAQAANVTTATIDLTNYINNIQDEFVMVYTYRYIVNDTKLYYIVVVKINKANNSVSELSTFRMGQNSGNLASPQASNYQFINNKLTINFKDAVTIYPSSSIQQTYYSPEIYIIGVKK